MNRTEFIQELRHGLQGLPKADIHDILYDYQEHFEIGLSKGKTETEIAQELGSPRQIAKSHRANATITRAENDPTVPNIVRALLAGMALGFFNLVFVLGPFLAEVGMLFAFFAVAVALALGGLGAVVGGAFAPILPNVNSFLHPLTAISFGTGMTALGVLLFIGGGYLTKFLFTVTIKYLRWNIDLITR